MATITRYVDPNAAAGGDGTTNGLSGSTCAYASMSIWEAAQQQDLTDGGGDIAECICDSNGGAADTTAVTIDGWTTNSTSYIWIHTPTSSRHDGKWNTSKYRLQVANLVLSIPESYVRIEGIQIYCTVGWANCIDDTVVSALGKQISYCILRGGTKGYAGYGTLFNCIAYDNATGFEVRDGSLAYNCTAHSTTTAGFSMPGFATGATLKNCLSAAASGSDFVRSGSSWTIEYCASQDATADDWGGTGNRASQTFTFVNAASDDFHLASSDAGAKDFGVSDPGSGLFSDDIDGQTRSGSWDIGADEYVSAATAAFPFFRNPMAHMLVR